MEFSEISVQIYFARYGHSISDRLLHEYLEMIPAKIRVSIERYQRWQDRQATLFGKLLLLKALQTQSQATYLNKFHSMKVSRFGKPFIEGGPEFSISHSQDIVVVALTQSNAIGIDIEKIHPVDKNDFIKELPEVAAFYNNHAPDQANHLFFDCWTKKESVLKALGKGLLVPLKEVVLKEDQACVDKVTWFIKRLSIDEHYSCHIATQRPLEQFTVVFVNLLNGYYNLNDI